MILPQCNIALNSVLKIRNPMLSKNSGTMRLLLTYRKYVGDSRSWRKNRHFTLELSIDPDF